VKSSTPAKRKAECRKPQDPAPLQLPAAGRPPAKPNTVDNLKAMHTPLTGCGGYRHQLSQVFGTELQEGAFKHVSDTLLRMNTRDPLEEMLVVQALWTHTRLARLSSIANQQTNPNHLKVVNDACDRAANTFRRQMLALAEYRRPPAQMRSWQSNRRTWHNSRWCRMSKTENRKMIKHQTKRDCPPPTPRHYRLSPEGLKSLRDAIRRVKPWQTTPGPRTAVGKARSKLNALKHGERAAERIAARREQWAILRVPREERQEDDAAAHVAVTGLSSVWLARIGAEIIGEQPYKA
jgi:hypothetical protein